MAREKVITNPNDFESIVVNGCLIEPNTIYEIVPKEPSPNSNPNYVQLGSVKERIPGVGNTVSLTQSDTGFFDASPVFNRMEATKHNWTLRAELAEKYFNIFAKPLKNYIADIERIKIPTDNEFFDSIYPGGYFTVTIKEGLRFDTSNPLDRFRLYIAIVEGELAMQGKRDDEEKELGLKDEQDMFNQDAQYAYISISNRKNKKQELAELEMEVAYKYGDLIRNDKDVLIAMLSYINIQVKQTASNTELNTIYKTRIESDKSKFKDFVNLLEKYENDSDNLIKEFDLLQRLKTKMGRTVVTKKGTTYYFDDKALGSNHKSIVSFFLRPGNEEVLEKFYKLTLT